LPAWLSPGLGDAGPAGPADTGGVGRTDVRPWRRIGVTELPGRRRREERRFDREATRYRMRQRMLSIGVAPGENDVLILAATAVIDTMAHPGR
jgi:hypothetical protein